MRRLLAVLTVVGALSLLAACGSDEPETDTSQPVTVEIEFSGDTVTPAGDRIRVAKGQEVEFEVKADAPGEIHVHTTPDKTLPYDAGTTLIEVGTFDRPGVYSVESHALGKTIVQLEVS